jgi:hypothetical protein
MTLNDCNSVAKHLGAGVLVERRLFFLDMNPTQREQTIVVGAGLCGLAVCKALEDRGESCLLLEQESSVGGKIKTEVAEDGYLLDAGFQVLLPSYTELKERIDLKALDLKYFNAGAMIRIGSSWTKVSDPLRSPLLAFETLFSNVGSFKDKILVLKLRAQVLFEDEDSLLGRSLGSTLDYLRSFGFSEQMIENFWIPFFSGIFLESELKTEAAFFRFLFKMFALSPVAVPANGMGELPKAMLAQLNRTELRLNARVEEVSSKHVVLSGHQLLGGRVIDTRPTIKGQWGSVCTLYFAADESPVSGPWLMLNSKKNKKLINHIAVMSEVSSVYAPKGDALISVNVIASKLSESSLQTIKDELVAMFGPKAEKWRFLKSFEIPNALPLYFSVPNLSQRLNTPSQQGAFKRAKQLIAEPSQLPI